ncbi:MAG: hypothetical protein ACR2JW_14705 [Thermomicrobiales bacterium]
MATPDEGFFDLLKWTHKLLLTPFIGLAFFAATQAVGATAVSAVIESGRLTITDAPVALTYSSAATADNMRVLEATFSLGVTDATGKKAGWHIQAMLGPLTHLDGTRVPVRSSAVTEAHVATLTGSAPASLLSYPHTFRANGDTIFSAAAGSGMGKSSLTFGTEIAIAADAAASDPLTAILTVTIAASP